MAGQKVSCTNRDILEGFIAMGQLAGTSWADPKVALRIGRSYREIRKAHDELEKDRTVLVDKYGIREPDGSYAKESDGVNVRMSDPLAFKNAWDEALAEAAEIVVFPVDIGALHVGQAKKGNCKECHRAVGPNLSPFFLEVLVNIGVVSGADELEEPKKQEAATTEE